MSTAVFDANTIVPATLVPARIPGRLLRAAQERAFTLVTSMAIITEVTRALRYPRIQRKYRIGTAEIERVRLLLEVEALLVPLTREVHGVATHPEDDLILATAFPARADYLVTSDRHPQNLQLFEGTAILSPRSFLTILG